jgi:hypothetical protein
MKSMLLFLCLLAAGVCLALSGCHRHEETVYYDNEPQYVVVPEPPPALVVEERPACPSEGCIWIDGYWHWDNHHYVWTHGHWQKPPHEDVTWVAPRYERHEQEHRYSPGHWRGHRVPEGAHTERHER